MEEEMIEQIKINIKEKTIWAKCNNCGAIIRDPSNLGEHKSSGKINYECPTCLSSLDKMIIVGKGEDPPLWWREANL